mmetsp:Transcript_33073/g.77160  ORF Transcript_33073/g.77160 Transcript_33073/m.77160 type:complete len:270 (+) Transcript_33073:273-1082(+)
MHGHGQVLPVPRQGLLFPRSSQQSRLAAPATAATPTLPTWTHHRWLLRRLRLTHAITGCAVRWGPYGRFGFGRVGAHMVHPCILNSVSRNHLHCSLYCCERSTQCGSVVCSRFQLQSPCLRVAVASIDPARMSTKPFENLRAQIQLPRELVHPRLLQEFDAFDASLHVLARNHRRHSLLPAIADRDQAAWACFATGIEREAVHDAAKAQDLPAVRLLHAQRLKYRARADHGDVFKLTQEERHEADRCLMHPAEAGVRDDDHPSELLGLL